ncbi:MAG: hypothetical protein U9Q80_06945 [Bacillota bacterium]|nr:hypothetical protein [Bacillota bacterium]
MTITCLDVVRIYCNNGKKIYIGTKNPEELEFTINYEISRTKG